MHGHVEVFIDESGDLGFSTRSSKHLVIAALATAEPHRLARIVRRAHKRFSLADGPGSEFKFNRSGERLRRFFLESISRTDSWIVWGAATKSGASQRSMAEKDALWQYTAARTIAELSKRTLVKRIHLVADRRSLTKVARRRVTERLQWEIRRHHAGSFPPCVTVSHVDSACSAGLQVADCVAGAVFLSLERGNHSYLREIEEKVLHGEVYW